MRVRFDDFAFDSDAMQLERDGREVRLSRKAFELLRIVLANRDRVVTKPELHALLWPDTYVVDTNLNVLVAEVRRALGDNARDARLLKTVHGVGYRFCGAVTDVAARTTAAVRGWLLVNDRTYPLPAGETLIGRDPACDVWLDEPGVSRRHARILTGAAGELTIEDMQSTNGTYLRGTLITAPARLDDGDEIHLGSVELTFRAAGRSKETERVRPPASRH